VERPGIAAFHPARTATATAHAPAGLLHTRICDGGVARADAQRMFEQNWVQAWEQLGQP
jgi:hypothetical protein